MKVTDIRRKLAAALVAGGLLSPATLRAADLDANLAFNPSFEIVDIFTPIGNFDAAAVAAGWTGPAPTSATLGAYNYEVHDFYNGVIPPGAGDFYLTTAATGTSATQVVNLAGGATGSLIAGGSAVFNASAYFSNYADQGDRGTFTVTFRNSGGTTLGAPVVIDAAGGLVDGALDWIKGSAAGIIPQGTSSALLSLAGTNTVATGGFDGYFDLVDFRVTTTLVDPALRLTVDRNDGGLTLSNLTGGPVSLSSYSIQSAAETLEPANWLSIADNYDAGSPGPNQVDSVNNWTESTAAGANGDLSESSAGAGATLANNRTVNLGNANAWLKYRVEDLTLRYVSGGVPFLGTVVFEGNDGRPFANGDLNANGIVGSDDWTIFKTNHLASMTGLSEIESYRLGDLNGDFQNNHVDFVEFKAAFDAANGVGAFEAMLAAVPEPASIMTVAVGAFALPVVRRRAAAKRAR